MLDLERGATNEKQPSYIPAVIRFRSEESALYSDQTVRLTDPSHDDLIRQLHIAFSRFQTSGVIREPLTERLNDTLYEEDYQQANAQLAGKSWATLDLNTAAFLVGFSGCLGIEETLALLPFHFEILLRADCWVWPFELVITQLHREPEDPSLQTAYEDADLRRLVESSLRKVGLKFVADAEFNRGGGPIQQDRAIREWAS